MQKRVGLRAIAQESGYHSSTVSLALRGDPSIPAETIKEITECAKRMGYKKDASLNLIMSKVRQSEEKSLRPKVAYLVENSETFRSDSNYYPHYLGAKAEAERIGYELSIRSIRKPGQSVSQNLKSLVKEGVQILLLPGWDIKILNEIEKGQFIVVLIGYSYHHFHYVGCDFFEAMNLVLERVRESSYKSVGLTFWHDENWNRTNSHFLASVLLFESSRPEIKIVPRLLVKSHQEQEFNQWYEEHHPELVVSDCTEVYGWLRKLNSQAGFIHLFQNNLYPEIAGIDQRLEIVGQKAVELCSSLFLQKHSGLIPFTQHISIIGEWHEGASFQSGGVNS